MKECADHCELTNRATKSWNRDSDDESCQLTIDVSEKMKSGGGGGGDGAALIIDSTYLLHTELISGRADRRPFLPHHSKMT